MELLFKISRFLYAATMAFFGYQHLKHGPSVSRFVPAYMPWHLFWTYLAGVAFIAAAIGMVINKTARLAGLLLGLMIFSFVILIDVPIAVNNINDGSGMTSLLEETGLACGAIILAHAFPRRVNV